MYHIPHALPSANITSSAVTFTTTTTIHTHPSDGDESLLQGGLLSYDSEASLESLERGAKDVGASRNSKRNQKGGPVYESGWQAKLPPKVSVFNVKHSAFMRHLIIAICTLFLVFLSSPHYSRFEPEACIGRGLQVCGCALLLLGSNAGVTSEELDRQYKWRPTLFGALLHIHRWCMKHQSSLPFCHGFTTYCAPHFV